MTTDTPAPSESESSNSPESPSEGGIHSLKSWAIVCLVMGVSLAIGGWMLQSQEQGDPLDVASAIVAMNVGIGLVLSTPILAWLMTRFLSSDLKQNRAIELAGTPAAKMFWVSFLVLFLEVALIRYCNAQIRIFAFYKNVPLIAAFIGLGLGCFQSKGTAHDAYRFLLWLFPLLAILSAGDVVIGGLIDRSAAIGSSEHILGDQVVKEASTLSQIINQIVMAAFCAISFLVLSQLFMFLGRLLGEVFEEMPRLPAYTVNIAGSLAGILGFSAVSYLQTTPPLWFLVGFIPLLFLTFRGAYRWPIGLLCTASILVVVPNYGDTIWSPYQRLVGHETDWPRLPGYMVRISNVFYQQAADLSDDTLERYGSDPFPHYNQIGQFLKQQNAERVLVIASGSGNDVAALLRADIAHVDAVDIDPAIIELGRQHHPEKPYDDPRVNIIIDDARAVFRELKPNSYDAVVFGLLDSHTQLGMSSVRLDNYVFTQESFEEVKNLIRPGGHLVVTAATFREWFANRLNGLITATTGPPVFEAKNNAWMTLIGEVPDEGTELAKTEALLPTDNWPYLYLENRTIPASYLWTLLVMGVASVLFLRQGGLRIESFSAAHGHLFFLGAAFLLMEIHAINRLALLMGTTWIVSAVSIALVLLLIMLANVTVLWCRQIPYTLSYAGLALMLILSYSIDPQAALPGGSLSPFVYGIILLSPVYFAGLIFARSFGASTQAASAAIGANILGSVLGGLSEYSSMALGIRALVVIGMIFYAMSAAMLVMSRKTEKAAEA